MPNGATLGEDESESELQLCYILYQDSAYDTRVLTAIRERMILLLIWHMQNEELSRVLD